MSPLHPERARTIVLAVTTATGLLLAAGVTGPLRVAFGLGFVVAAGLAWSRLLPLAGLAGQLAVGAAAGIAALMLVSQALLALGELEAGRTYLMLALVALAGCTVPAPHQPASRGSP